MPPEDVINLAQKFGLEVQVELGEKQGGSFTAAVASSLIDRGHRWLAAGADQVIVEGRESAQGIGLFDETVDWTRISPTDSSKPGE